jgi:hypothetical protein
VKSASILAKRSIDRWKAFNFDIFAVNDARIASAISHAGRHCQ